MRRKLSRVPSRHSASWRRLGYLVFEMAAPSINELHDARPLERAHHRRATRTRLHSLQQQWCTRNACYKQKVHLPLAPVGSIARAQAGNATTETLPL
eukprot:1073920-Lingulodinium_polyedra.AAC.1